MDGVLRSALHDLEAMHARSLGALQTDPMERGRPGVYTLWHGPSLLYVGMARMDQRDTSNPQARGLFGRLQTHYDVFPQRDPWPAIWPLIRAPLSPADLEALRQNNVPVAHRLRPRLQEFARREVSYRWIITSGGAARAIEDHVRRVGLPTAGRPLVNPKC